jgi:hypothetical protein
MSTATIVSPRAVRAAGARPGLARLTAVELRKMTDTRAGFWLLVATVALTALVVVVAGFALDEQDRTLRRILSIAVQPATIVLPIVGILLVSSEWSQRTALLTFTLVPDRTRVLIAKLLAGVVLALVALQICLAAAALGTAVAAPGTADDWSLSAVLVGQVALYVVLPMIIGVGFGAMLLSSAPAIVLYFVLPTAWSALGSLEPLEAPARWLDQARTMEPMLEHAMSGTEWARLGTTLALWMLVPLLVGLWRVTRSDVR